MSLILSVRSKVEKSKLGRCPKCIGQSFLGMIVSWSVFGLVNLLKINYLVDITLIAAIGFTLLVVSHFIVLAFRIRRQLNDGRTRCCGEEISMSKEDEKSESFWERNVSRREFLQTIFTIGLAAGISSLIPRFALGQVADTCTGKFQTWLAGSQTATFVVCATGCGGGAGGVRDRFQNKQAGADEFCKQKSAAFCPQWTCLPVNQIPHSCRLTTAVLNGKAKVSVQSCKEIRLADGSKHACAPPVNGSDHEVVLVVKFGSITCNCGCMP